jgi:hypothetical protein
VREIIYSVITGLLDRFDAFRYRRRAQSRFWRADQGIALVLLIGILGVGVLAATAVTKPDSETPFIAQSNAARVSSFSRTEVVTETVKRPEVVTETVKRQGRPVRLVLRHRPGRTVQDLVTLPARTVREMQTVTTREVVTVTAIQPVTVTVFETVTCKPNSC